jgi:tetratricopeptide (TPR) repeat protein
MYKLLGQYEQSRMNYYEALRIYERVLGKDHASYATSLHNLGNLNRSQLHLDESLSAMDRLQLNEEAMSYLEEAWVIRQAELGDEHPHTVASRSNLGSAMAAQVLQIQSQQLEQQKKEWKIDDDKQSVSPKVKKPSKFTLKRWEVAEEHLRAALQTAIQNPRGSQMTAATDSQHSSICTLSAASAAQNLAVFLKSRAIVQQPQTDEDSLHEAKQLYQQVLHVRSELLHETHPDTVATKFSLAELLAVLGDEDGANKIREEILESHGDVIMGKDAAAGSSSGGGGVKGGHAGNKEGPSEHSKPSKQQE